jgi:hypothetical protein
VILGAASVFSVVKILAVTSAAGLPDKTFQIKNQNFLASLENSRNLIIAN